MERYVCISECGEIAIYKATDMPRLYRLDYPGKHKGVKILSYKTQKRAQEVCDHTEKIGNGRFITTLIDM